MKLGDCSERFVRGVYIRLVVLRALEAAGIGAALAAALGAVLVGALMFEGRSTWEVASAMLGIGATVGLAWGVVKRPTKLEAAAEADRQLGLNDLLASALFVMRGKAEGDWGDSVVKTADAQCQALSPSTLVLNRLGARAWGGIGLSVALVATLSVMATLPEKLEAGNDRRPAEMRSLRTRADVAKHSGGDASVEQQKQGAQEGKEGSRRSDSSKTAASPDDGRDGHPGNTSASAGVGAAAGKAADSTVPPLKTAGRPRLEDGQTVASGSGAAKDAQQNTTSGGPGTAAATETPGTPRWQHDDWSRLREQALDSVRSGRVPDSYSPVIREYFDQTVE